MLPLIAGYVMGKRAAAGMSSAASALGVGPAAAVEVLDERLDRTLLVIEALWTLLKEHGYTDEQLAARISELDEADGMVDGRHVPDPLTCRSCGSKVPAGLPRCQFCGAETGQADQPFAGL
ncbi:MAG TPA: hypothetical protein VIA81_03180 [Acidimicrobiia bacterium]|jgi:hypothetical protein